MTGDDALLWQVARRLLRQDPEATGVLHPGHLQLGLGSADVLRLSVTERDDRPAVLVELGEAARRVGAAPWRGRTVARVGRRGHATITVHRHAALNRWIRAALLGAEFERRGLAWDTDLEGEPVAVAAVPGTGLIGVHATGHNGPWRVGVLEHPELHETWLTVSSAGGLHRHPLLAAPFGNGAPALDSWDALAALRAVLDDAGAPCLGPPGERVATRTERTS